MQHCRCADTSPHPGATDRHRSTHPSIPRHLPPLIHPHSYADRANTCPDARRHTACAQAHTDIERSYGDPYAHSRRGRASCQCKHHRHG